MERFSKIVGQYFDEDKYEFYCDFCRQCNRCCEGFDHHCVWLNNCIGRSNYKSFFILMCVALA